MIGWSAFLLQNMIKLIHTGWWLNRTIENTLVKSDHGQQVVKLVVSTHLKNMFVNLEIFPKFRGENFKIFELPPPI